jgi:hypothetical protein
VKAGFWPVVGEKASRAGDTRPWSVRVWGAVETEAEWSLDDLTAMPRVEREIDIHCVTRWSMPGARFAGTELVDLLERCGPAPDAGFVVFHARSDRNHTTSLPLADVRELRPLVAYAFEGAPLASEHGGPVRIVTPGRYFYKSVKWLEGVELTREDRLGWWERESGYHNRADPWLEERYIVPGVPTAAVVAALRRRDLTGMQVLGLSAAGRNLAGLKAAGAQLRDADLRGAVVTGADFRGANLSNAHCEGADMRGACFAGADVEGADFSGCDLRGADFRDASVFGATFVGAAGRALLDRPHGFSAEQVSALTPEQAAFLSH